MRTKVWRGLTILVIASMIAMGLVGVVATTASASSWKANVDTSATCAGVTVTANPETVYTDHSGKDQERYVPISVTGTGTFGYDANGNASGSVTVTWKQQVSHDFGNTWTDGSQTSTGSSPYSWSDKQPNDCGPKKVYVCKYVGKPGVDERLQTGQNPIEVSVNAIPENPVTVGSYFADAQGRSYVLGFVPMDPEPTADDCPPADTGHTWTADFVPGATCSDAYLTVKVYEDGSLVDTETLDYGNVWVDPYGPESYPVSGTFTYQGHDFSYNKTIDKPSTCIKQHEWNASFTGDSNCTDAWINVAVYEDGVLVKTDKIDKGNIWVKPFEPESYTFAVTYTYSGQTFGQNVTITKDEACIQEHDWSATFTAQATCDSAWLDVVVYEDGQQVATDKVDLGDPWTNPYETETYQASGTYTYQGHDFSYNKTVQEPSDCTITLLHNHSWNKVNTCTGYDYAPVSTDGGVFVPDTTSAPLTGLWKDPKNPDESVTITGTWKWPDGTTIKDSITVKKNTSCTPESKNWKPTCPVCDLIVHGLERIVSWPTDQGDAGWKTRKLEGSGKPGVAVYVSIDDCSTSKAARCTLTQKIHVEANMTALVGKKVQFFDNGSERPLTVHLGADGNQWGTYDGTVCTWIDDKNNNRKNCDSSNDWYATIDGVRQLPYVYDAPNNLLYPYWVCSLPPTMAMTRQAADGSWEIEWLPGMNTWTASIFWLKYTNQWPLGWPEDTSQHSWVWNLPPLKDARAWANAYRAVGQYNYYKLPSK